MKFKIKIYIVKKRLKNWFKNMIKENIKIWNRDINKNKVCVYLTWMNKIKWNNIRKKSMLKKETNG